MYTKASLHPIKTGVAVAVGLGAVIFAGRELLKRSPAVLAVPDQESQTLRAEAKTQAID